MTAHAVDPNDPVSQALRELAQAEAALQRATTDLLTALVEYGASAADLQQFLKVLQEAAAKPAEQAATRAAPYH
jgi:hypothetical protein